MFQEHSTFIQPENEDMKVWRYMDFTKFVSLIESYCLYFTRVDKFDDPFEGSWPKINVTSRKIIPENLPSDGHKNFFDMMQKIGELHKQWPRFNAINCWHINNYESAAMWKLYLKSDEGIAIQSTYSKLKKSLIDRETVYLGKVIYLDYDTDSIDERNLLGPFVHKRRSFAHEQEIRALVTKWPIFNTSIDFKQNTIEHGLKIKVDLETLVEKVFVAPGAPVWFADLIKSIIVQYGFSFEVVHSKLNENPVYYYF